MLYCLELRDLLVSQLSIPYFLYLTYAHTSLSLSSSSHTKRKRKKKKEKRKKKESRPDPLDRQMTSRTHTTSQTSHAVEENVHSDTNNDHRRQAQSLLDAARNAAENMQYTENEVDDLTYHSQIADTYEKVVTWQRNLFNIPLAKLEGLSWTN